MHDLDAQMKMAYGLHAAGKLEEAESLYRMVLEASPSHMQAMAMLGMIFMDSQRNEEADALFGRMLDMAPEHPHALHNRGRLAQLRGDDLRAVSLLQRACKIKPDFAPIHNDLAVSFHRIGKFEEALVALDHALSIDPGFAMAHDNMGVVLYDCQRFTDACEAHLKALQHTHAMEKRSSVLLNLAAAACEASNLALAEQACSAMLDADENHAGAMEQLAKVFYRQRRDEEALALLNRLARMQGLESRAGPECPEATILVLGGAGASHVSTKYLFDPALFARLSLVMLTPDQPDAPLGSVSWRALAGVDIVFIALSEVEKNGGQFEAVKELSARLKRPLFNSPDLIARTGRDQAPEIFGRIEGLRVPCVRWMMRGESCPSFPLLIRPAGTHGGKDLSLIGTATELVEYMGRTPEDRYLLSEFVDFRSADGHYRKYRFIFVDREPYPYHLAIAENWMVHYWRTDMRSVDWKRREEEAFLADWKQVFGSSGAAAVEQVGQFMNLDYGGMDCSILPDGQVLFFEANASMLTHLDDADPEFKKHAVSRIRDAMTRMVRASLARRS